MGTGREPIGSSRIARASPAATMPMKAAETNEKGLQGVLWSLMNTLEFLLQH